MPGNTKQFPRSFDAWSIENPGRPFSDFYAEKMTNRDLSNHRTLGLNSSKGDAGRFLERLIGFGLQPDRPVVDYGCGTLRMGFQVIRYLHPGLYWGLDMVPRLLEDGAKRLTLDDVAKSPKLRLISPETIAEATAAKPHLLFSHIVMQHVHPDELGVYLANIVSIIGSEGQALIRGQISRVETIRYAQSGWAHSLNEIEHLVSDLGAEAVLLKGRGRDQACAWLRIASA